MRKFLLRVEELENASAVAIADLDENQITSAVVDRSSDPSEDVWNALLEACALIHQKVAPSLVILANPLQIDVQEQDTTVTSSE